MITLLLLHAVLGQSVPDADSGVSPLSVPAPIVSPSQAILLDLPADRSPAAEPPPSRATTPPPAAAPAAPSAPNLPSTSSIDTDPPPAAMPPPPRDDNFRPMPGLVAQELDAPAFPPRMGRERPAPSFGPWQVGIAAGDAGGFGISVRRWFSESNALQLNFAPYLYRENIPGTDDPNDRERDLDSGFRLDASITVGLTWLHSHLEKPMFHGKADLQVLSYVAGSTDLAVEQQQIDHIVLGTDGTTKTVVYDDYYRTTKEFCLGGGGGFEMSWWRLSVFALVGLDGWYEATSEDFGFNPDGQIGAHFRF